MNTPRRALTVLLTLLLAACGGSSTPTPDPVPAPAPGPTPNPGPGAAPNNSAVLTGAALGTGVTPESDLQRVVGASLSSPNPAFRLGEAYVTRTSADAQTLYWFVEVTNESSGLQCLVGATDIELRDSAGTPLAVDERDYVSGSVGFGPLAEGQGYTDTCLQAGARGFMSGFVLESDAPSAYALVSSVGLGAVSGTGGFVAPAARLIPQSYALTDTGFTVSVKNEGAGAATLGQSSVYFLLDEAGRPLLWENFSDDGAGSPVAVGATRVLGGTLTYSGQATRLQVQLSFEGP